MKFKCCRCVLCDNYFYDHLDVVAFRETREGPKLEDLGGKAPRLGVRCICIRCARFFVDVLQGYYESGTA